MATHHRIILLLLLLLLPALVAAQQDVVVEINATTVSNIISVSAQSITPRLIPGYEYSSRITVNWAIPLSSLEGLVADKVTVFVRARIDGGAGVFYFKDGQNMANASYFTLDCVLENSSCAESSSLSHQVDIFMRMPANSTLVNDSARLVLEASLRPFDEFAPIYEESIILGKEIEGLKQRLSDMNLSVDNVSAVADGIEQAERLIESYHNEEAKARIDGLKPSLGLGGFSLPFISLDAVWSGWAALTEDLYYLAAFIIAAALLVSAITFRMRSGGKMLVCIIALTAGALSFFQIISALIILVAEIAVAAIMMTILFTRGGSRRRPVRARD